MKSFALVAPKRLYKSACPSGGPYVCSTFVLGATYAVYTALFLPFVRFSAQSLVLDPLREIVNKAHKANNASSCWWNHCMMTWLRGGHVLLNNFGAAGPSLALVTWFVKFDEITIFTDSVGL